jgi:hypothetical protein
VRQVEPLAVISHFVKGNTRGYLCIYILVGGRISLKQRYGRPAIPQGQPLCFDVCDFVDHNFSVSCSEIIGGDWGSIAGAADKAAANAARGNGIH